MRHAACTNPSLRLASPLTVFLPPPPLLLTPLPWPVHARVPAPLPPCPRCPCRTVFNGNGKLPWELEYAVGQGVLVNVDSEFDLHVRAALRRAAVGVGLRLRSAGMAHMGAVGSPVAGGRGGNIAWPHLGQ